MSKLTEDDMFLFFVKSVFKFLIVMVLFFVAILGISNIDSGGAWFCTPALIIMLILLLEPWNWTKKGMKEGLVAFAVIGGFLFFLLSFVLPPIAILYVIDQEYLNMLDMLGMLAISVLAYLGMSQMIKKGWFHKL